MSVTNYTPDKCKYWLGKLSKHVYLISENSVKDIRIDNGEALIQSISETPIRIDCSSINLTDEESLDERYKFNHTLTFSVNGYANEDDFQDRYYVIVKDNNNTYWLVNPLFPCKVTYTFTLGYQQNQTDFTIGTVSNHPVLKLNGMSDGEPYQCKKYWLDGIDKIWLNVKKYTVHNGNHIKYTNEGGFQTVDYNNRSAIFTEQFDGKNIKHSIEFDILFSNYKSSWHYNLLEFNDNTYATVIKTNNGKYALCGFSLGLQPSLTVNADDTTQEVDKIHISLEDTHDAGDTIEMFDSVDYEYLSAKTWVYTSDYEGYECIADGVAKYILQKEVDALENETGNFKALAGYENNFPELEIDGTFDSVATFQNNECRIKPCMLSTSLQNNIVFTDISSKTYTLRAGSDWTIEHDSNISVSPESGSADVDYIITITNNTVPTTTAWITNYKVRYCYSQQFNGTITVAVDNSGCFQDGSIYYVSANSQTLRIPTKCCIKDVKERTSIGITSTIYSNYITVYVPENNTGIDRTMILLITLCDGSVTNISINQNNVFVEWRVSGTLCEGNNKIQREYKWTGTTSSNYVITDEYRDTLIERESPDCIPVPQYRWVNTNKTSCVEVTPLYRVTSGTPYCVDADLYVDLTGEVSYDNGATWEVYSTASTLVEKDSSECGYVPPITGDVFVFSDGTTSKTMSVDSGTTPLDINIISTYDGSPTDLYSLGNKSTWIEYNSHSSTSFRITVERNDDGRERTGIIELIQNQSQKMIVLNIVQSA